MNDEVAGYGFSFGYGNKAAYLTPQAFDGVGDGGGATPDDLSVAQWAPPYDTGTIDGVTIETGGAEPELPPEPRLEPKAGSNHAAVVKRHAANAAAHGTYLLDQEKTAAAAAAAFDLRTGWGGAALGVGDFASGLATFGYDLTTLIMQDGWGHTGAAIVKDFVNTPSTFSDAWGTGDMRTLAATGLGLLGLPEGRLGQAGARARAASRGLSFADEFVDRNLINAISRNEVPPGGVKAPNSIVAGIPEVGRAAPTFVKEGWTVFDTRNLYDLGRYADEISRGYDQARDAVSGKFLGIVGIPAKEGVPSIQLSQTATAAINDWSIGLLSHLRYLLPNEPLQIGDLAVVKGFALNRADKTPSIHTDPLLGYLVASNTLRGSSTVVFPDSIRLTPERNGGFRVFEGEGQPVISPEGTTVVFSGSGRALTTGQNIPATVHASPPLTDPGSSERISLFLSLTNRDITLKFYPVPEPILRVDADFAGLSSRIKAIDKFPEDHTLVGVAKLRDESRDFLRRYATAMTSEQYRFVGSFLWEK
jgi:hypothetical protein